MLFNCTNSSVNCTEDFLYEVPLGVIVVLSCLYGSISVIAVTGNVLVIWIVASSKSMQNVTNWYISNLALADIAIGLFAIPFEVSFILETSLGGTLNPCLRMGRDGYTYISSFSPDCLKLSLSKLVGDLGLKINKLETDWGLDN